MTSPARPSSRAQSQPTAAPVWASSMVRMLDDGIKLPGTRYGIGLDAILGFFCPTIGDATTGLVSLSLLWLAFRMRVPKVVVFRIVLNIAVDVLIGCVPILGD